MAIKPVTSLVPGDVLPGAPRVVKSVTRTATQVTATFEDDTSQTWDLTGEPAVELPGD